MTELIGRAGAEDVSPLVRRLSAGVPLSDAEIAFLESLQSNRVAYGAGETLIRDGEELRACIVIRGGWAMRYRVTRRGRRQILGLSLPGDVLGAQVNFHRRAIASTAALTPLEVALVEPSRLLDIYREYPVLAAGLEWMTVHTFNILSEHTVSLGARSARERVLHFLLEIWCRLAQVGEAGKDSFRMLLTQQQIADAMGLSQVHTNKTLRRLEAEGLIARKRRELRFPDLDRAIEAAEFDRRFLETFRARRPSRDAPPAGPGPGAGQGTGEGPG